MTRRSRPPEPTVRPRIRVSRAEEILLGPGKADLLEAIRRSGRLRGAADELGMSYMRAWKLVQMLNRGFREPLVRTERGGAGHGKTTLTPMGESVLALYRTMERSSLAAIDPAWKRLKSLLAS
ncbi:MAG: LysR family transcriptional regulator [Acidobacteria bacterium]|nr:LysR family transcriptional regulator [Acidobacteriota bacterium]MCA1611992.1 LysR family transcriptional regulator [Acidobacteriota bacterium]